MNKLKCGIKNRSSSTPVAILKIADSIQAACVAALGYSVWADNKTLMVGVVCVFIVSKFISEMFTESSDKSD